MVKCYGVWETTKDQLKHTRRNTIIEHLQIEIKPYKEKYSEQVILVWEKSVRTTDHFVTLKETDRLKELVNNGSAKDSHIGNIQKAYLKFSANQKKVKPVQLNFLNQFIF